MVNRSRIVYISGSVYSSSGAERVGIPERSERAFAARCLNTCHDLTLQSEVSCYELNDSVRLRSLVTDDRFANF